jgi:hypothetical protein
MNATIATATATSIQSVGGVDPVLTAPIVPQSNRSMTRNTRESHGRDSVLTLATSRVWRFAQMDRVQTHHHYRDDGDK